MTILTVGVVGAGQMGNGIAHVAALAGFDVVLSDLSADRVKSALATINGNLSRQVAKGTITYVEEDGSHETVPVTGGHCKLQWKPDMGMRWAALGARSRAAGGWPKGQVSHD